MGEGGKGAEPNMPAKGTGRWNNVGGVGEADWREDGWGDGDKGSTAGELGGMGRGEAAWREDVLGVGDEGSIAGELSDMGRGETPFEENGWAVGDEGSSSSELGGMGRENRRGGAR